MKRYLKALIVAGCAAAVLAGGTVAFAASSNISDLESAWLDFQAKLNQEMVNNGDITQEEADQTYNDLKEQFEASGDDVVYQHFTAAPVQALNQGRSNGLNGRADSLKDRNAVRTESANAIQQYAELTKQETLTIRETLQEQDMNIWQLAEQEGNFDALKNTMLAELDKAIYNAQSGSEAERLQRQRDDIASMTSAEDYNAPQNLDGLGRMPGRIGGAQDGAFGGKKS